MSIFKRFAVAVGAVAVVASSAFASWDYFPPKEEGGEARLEFGYNLDAEAMSPLVIGGRYTIIPGLEASVKLPMPLDPEFDIGNPVVGVRYWLMDMGLGFFADFIIPVEDGAEFDINAGVQYSMNITEEFKFGAELEAFLPVYDGKEFDLGLGLEFQYSIGAITPFLGLDMKFGLPDEADFDVGTLWVGATYDINDMISADLKLDIANLANDADVGMAIGVGVSVNF